MIVELSPSELSIAYTLAVMRNASNRQSRVIDKQKGKQDPIQIERDGIVGEIAFGKAFNLYPDMTVNPRHGGPDFVGKHGKKIDVKSTRVKNGRLLIHPEKEVGDVDVYVLAIVDESTVDLVGYIDAEKALQESNLGDVGHGKTYVIERSDLEQF